MKNRGRRDMRRTDHGCVMGSQPRRSLAQTEFFDQCAVRIGIAALEIVEQLAATADHTPVSYTHLDVYKRQHLRPQGYGEGVLQTTNGA